MTKPKNKKKPLLCRYCFQFPKRKTNKQAVLKKMFHIRIHENHENFIKIEIFSQFVLYHTDNTVPPRTCPNEVAANIQTTLLYVIYAPVRMLELKIH